MLVRCNARMIYLNSILRGFRVKASSGRSTDRQESASRKTLRKFYVASVPEIEETEHNKGHKYKERERGREKRQKERDWITKRFVFSSTNSPTKRHRFPYFLKYRSIGELRAIQRWKRFGLDSPREHGYRLKYVVSINVHRILAHRVLIQRRCSVDFLLVISQ